MILKASKFTVYLNEQDVKALIKERGLVNGEVKYFLKILLDSTESITLTFSIEEVAILDRVIEELFEYTGGTHKKLNI